MAHNLKSVDADKYMEARVTGNSRTLVATMTGAVIGGLAGYFFFTERGRALRRQIEPALEDFARELNSFGATVRKATGVASEGWKLLNEAMESGGSSVRYPSPHQSSPF